MNFKTLINLLKPANDDLSYMDVKEKSDLMEAAHEQAKQAIRIYFASRREWECACNRYEAQIKAKKRGI